MSARGRAVCVYLSGWACGYTRAHTACTRWSTCPSSRRSSSPCSPTPSRTRRPASPRIAIQLVTNRLCGSRVDTLEVKARPPRVAVRWFSGLACAQRAGCTGQHALQHSRGFVPAVRRALCCQPATHRPRPLALCFLGFRRSSICGLVRARVPGENDRCEFLLALLALFLRALSPGRTPRAKV